MKKLRFGVISASGMAQAHMNAIVFNKNTELVAICDIDKEKLDLCTEKYDVPGYTDYKELLKRDDIDAVVICTPDQLHREMLEEALKHNKHVLCEKPMALTEEDCRYMVKAAASSDKKVMVGQICRYTPGFVRAKELIDAGEIGELFFCETEYAHDYAHIQGAGNWRLDPLRHGFLGGGCHAVDLLLWIAGRPTEVTAYSNKKMLTTWPTDDCTIAIMKFPNDVIGKVFVSTGCKRNYTMRSVFYGSKGTIITDNTSPHMQVFKTDASCGYTTPMLYSLSINNHNATGEIADFADRILNDKPIATSAEEGAATVFAALAAIRSTKSGMPEKIEYNFE
ncbi:MAG: Gfo/Idh/MocA family oxidoreductase [Clostridia bacterium]|nr:Gfo/Idh/MocA family oxidoreductase [Clostridia bacterium]